MNKATKSGHVPVNGVRYYYEVHGTGTPLLLLHGGLQTLDCWGATLTALAAKHEVIAVELHGHGRTQLGDRKLDMVDQGRDLGPLVEQLGYSKVDVMGYSLGAAVAFQFAAQHAAKVRKLVLVSGSFSSDAFYPEMKPMQAALNASLVPMMKDTPMYKLYMDVAPDPAEFPKLMDAMGEYMRRDWNWADDVKKLTMPTLLVFGDSDMFTLESELAFYKLLGGGQRDAGWMREHMATNRLAILPNATHYEMIETPLLLPTIEPFLAD